MRGLGPLKNRDTAIERKTGECIAIFDKHFAMEQTEHLLNMGDFQYIVSYAKSQFVNLKLPAQISKREVYPSDVPHVLIIEAVLGYLNKSKVLKKLVKIDYTTR